MTSSLHSDYPWTTAPFVANAPMGGFAGSALATAVSRAKGMGFIGAVFDMVALSKQLEEVSQNFFGANGPAQDQTLPVGVGLLTFVAKAAEAIPVVQKFRPAAVWLFASHGLADFKVWTKEIRAASPKTKIWIQIGSVAGALHIAEFCKPDVIVMQGSDAGGHGWEKGASIMSLLPETSDELEAKGFEHIPIVAAGGIVDGRGVAAALALGASGVVMGTRFLSAPETTVPHEGYRNAILRTKDGGQNTVRAKVFDELKGPNIWPALFDGRAVVSESYTDHISGTGIEEIRKLHADAVKEKYSGYGIDGKGRAVVWAGTGVGLVSESKKAGEIVVEVMADAQKAVEKAKSRLYNAVT